MSSAFGRWDGRILKCVEPAHTDAYGEMLGWWDSAGLMIKDESGPLARALRRAETSHSQPLQIRCFDGTTKTILGPPHRCTALRARALARWP